MKWTHSPTRSTCALNWTRHGKSRKTSTSNSSLSMITTPKTYSTKTAELTPIKKQMNSLYSTLMTASSN
jgi:hypothetical protein